MKIAALLAVLLLAAACGRSVGDKRVLAASARAEEARERPAAGPKRLEIGAQGIQWDTTRLVVPIGREILLTIDNRDAGIPHNLRIQYGPGGGIATPVENGPIVQELRFTMPEPARAQFICDVHPNMVGTLQAV